MAEGALCGPACPFNLSSSAPVGAEDVCLGDERAIIPASSCVPAADQTAIAANVVEQPVSLHGKWHLSETSGNEIRTVVADRFDEPVPRSHSSGRCRNPQPDCRVALWPDQDCDVTGNPLGRKLVAAGGDRSCVGEGYALGALRTHRPLDRLREWAKLGGQAGSASLEAPGRFFWPCRAKAFILPGPPSAFG